MISAIQNTFNAYYRRDREPDFIALKEFLSNSPKLAPLIVNAPLEGDYSDFIDKILTLLKDSFLEHVKRLPALLPEEKIAEFKTLVEGYIKGKNDLFSELPRLWGKGYDEVPADELFPFIEMVMVNAANPMIIDKVALQIPPAMGRESFTITTLQMILLKILEDSF
jgi:hypothetical protein